MPSTHNSSWSQRELHVFSTSEKSGPLGLKASEDWLYFQESWKGKGQSGCKQDEEKWPYNIPIGPCHEYSMDELSIWETKLCVSIKQQDGPSSKQGVFPYNQPQTSNWHSWVTSQEKGNWDHLPLSLLWESLNLESEKIPCTFPLRYRQAKRNMYHPCNVCPFFKLFSQWY